MELAFHFVPRLTGTLFLLVRPALFLRHSEQTLELTFRTESQFPLARFP
jgi:hypothetical protein